MSEKLHWQCDFEDCESPKVGDNKYCMTHHKGLQKLSRDLKRQKEKRVVPISKMSQKQVGIETKLREVYEMMDAAAREADWMGRIKCSAYSFYSDNDTIIDHSHTISRARCKQLGKPELIADPENIEHCSRLAHMEWDNYEPGFVRHENFERRMAFIKLHDPHDYERRMEIWAKVNKPSATV